MTTNQLPPLPEPDGQMTVTFGIDEKRKVPVFFGDRLTAYARAALSQPAPSPQPAVPVVSDEQIEDLAWLDVDQTGALDTKDMANRGATAVQRAAFKRGASAILDLRPATLSAEFDVRNIMLDVVPGDGSGCEVYAKTNADVEQELTALYAKWEDLADTSTEEIRRLRAENAALSERLDAMRPAVDPMTDDTARLDYLQERGATVDLVAGDAGFRPLRFRVGGLHASVSPDIRTAIDAARGITAKAEGGAKP